MTAFNILIKIDGNVPGIILLKPKHLKSELNANFHLDMCRNYVEYVLMFMMYMFHFCIKNDGESNYYNI